MPSSPEINLKKIEEKAKIIIEKNKGTRIHFVKEPIAFGLKAIIANFEQDESNGELEPIEKELKKIKEINSVEVIDIRRAFG